jgi:hypothetical protein
MANVRRYLSVAGAALSAVLAAGIVVGSSVFSTGPQAGAAQPALSWLAAGDSYSSGEGLPHATGNCAQATPATGSQAWAFAAYDVLSKEGSPLEQPNLVACTGAKTSQFFSPSGSKPAEWSTPYQRDDLVTMTFGGDNIDFAPIIKQCIDLTRLSQVLRAIVRAWIPIDSGTSPFPSDSNHTCPSNSIVRKRIDALGSVYPAFLTKVATNAVAPGGNIILLGYPEVVELPKYWSSRNQNLGSCFGIGTGDATLLRGWAGDLNATLGVAVKRFDAEPSVQRDNVEATFVDVNSGGGVISSNDPNLFEPAHGTRHNLCSSDSWINGITTIDYTNGSFHPKQPGADAQGALAAEVIGKLNWSRLAPLPFSADTGDFAYESDFTNLQLDSVSCPADNDCVAAGDDFESDANGFTGVIEQWDGSAWTQAALPDPNGVDLYAVSCPNASFCMAVGRTQFEGNKSLPVAYTWNGQHWSSASPPASVTAAGEWVNLFGVSCATETSCVAVGAQESSDGGSSNPFAEEWSSATWQAPSVDQDLYGELLGVACQAAASCTAVGGGGTQEGDNDPLAYHWNGTALSNQPIPVPTGGPGNYSDQGGGESSYELHSVSCPTASSCIAVGDDGAVESLDGQSWKLDSSGPIDFVAIDCTSVSRCMATGGGPGNPVIESGSAAGWQSVAQAASSPVTPQAVWARPDGFTMVVGYDVGTVLGTPYAEDEPAL